jgi:hypothetical protein
MTSGSRSSSGSKVSDRRLPQQREEADETTALSVVRPIAVERVKTDAQMAVSSAAPAFKSR